MKKLLMGLTPFEKAVLTGFTLLETLVAVTLITLAMSAPFLAAERGYVAAQTAKNRLIASFLAQEGLEYIRLMRDNTYLINYIDGVPDVSVQSFYKDFLAGESGTTFSYSIAGCQGGTLYDYDAGTGLAGGNGSVECALDTSRPTGIGTEGANTALQVCSGGCPALSVTGNRYILPPGGTPSPFTRSIRVYNVFGTNQEIEVVSKVSWSYHNVPQYVELSLFLSPWQ